MYSTSPEAFTFAAAAAAAVERPRAESKAASFQSVRLNPPLPPLLSARGAAQKRTCLHALLQRAARELPAPEAALPESSAPEAAPLALAAAAAAAVA